MKAAHSIPLVHRGRREIFMPAYLGDGWQEASGEGEALYQLHSNRVCPNSHKGGLSPSQIVQQLHPRLLLHICLLPPLFLDYRLDPQGGYDVRLQFQKVFRMAIRPAMLNGFLFGQAVGEGSQDSGISKVSFGPPQPRAS